MRYTGRNRRRACKVEPDWPEELKQMLLDLCDKDPLDARLGEAWALQNYPKDRTGFPVFMEHAQQRPWRSKERQWWRKEREELALLQIAGRCQQRPIWCGANEVVELSGGNILTFVSLCQFIWEAHRQSSRARDETAIPEAIDETVQAVGVFRASDYWFAKIGQDTGHSGRRLEAVRNLGEALSRQLLQDRRMSYPGRNGISVADNELDADEDLKTLLQELGDYGNLLEMQHTTKEKDRRSRRKWYLNPVLCPRFKVTHKRLKEPWYRKVSEVKAMLEARPAPGSNNVRLEDNGTLSLFEWAGTGR